MTPDSEPDQYGRAVEKFISEQNGAELTPRVVFEFMVAKNADDKFREKRAQARHASTREMVRDHIVDDVKWRKELEKELDEREQKQADLCLQAHADLLRRAPRRADDPPDVTFGDPEASRSFKQMIWAWSLSRKALAIIATTLIGGLTLLGLSYTTAYFAADRAEKAGIQSEKTALPAPTVTVTASPEATP